MIDSLSELLRLVSDESDMESFIGFSRLDDVRADLFRLERSIGGFFSTLTLVT